MPIGCSQQQHSFRGIFCGLWSSLIRNMFSTLVLFLGILLYYVPIQLAKLVSDAHISTSAPLAMSTCREQSPIPPRMNVARFINSTFAHARSPARGGRRASVRRKSARDCATSRLRLICSLIATPRGGRDRRTEELALRPSYVAASSVGQYAKHSADGNLDIQPLCCSKVGPGPHYLQGVRATLQ